MSDASNIESTLLKLAAGGDRDAFSRLYINHLDDVKKFILLLTNDPNEADELVQDIFVRLWDNRVKLASIKILRDYLFRITKNRVLDHLRHQDVKRTVLQRLSANRQQAPTPQHELDYKEFYRKIYEGIRLLPPKRRQIFQLSTEDGMSYDQIAEHLQISKSGVKNQLYKAQDFMRQYLSDHGEKTMALLFLTGFSSI